MKSVKIHVLCRSLITSTLYAAPAKDWQPLALRMSLSTNARTIEDPVSYEKVTGAYLGTFAEQIVNTEVALPLSNVARGLIIVNTQDRTRVRGNKGSPAAGGTKVLWRLGQTAPLQECTTNTDSVIGWWDPNFNTSNTCIIPIEATSEVTLVIRPASWARQGSVSMETMSARYLILRTEQ